MKSLIYGYGVTGKSFERYLTNRNIPFDIFDENIDQHNKKINLSDYQTIFCSPGIPKDLYESLKQYAEVITDLDIFFKEDTQINTASHNYSGNSIDSETFLAGQTIYGLFTSITLTSGACIAYKI